MIEGALGVTGLLLGSLLVYWMLSQEKEYTHLYVTNKKLHTTKIIQVRKPNYKLVIRIRSAKFLAVMYVANITILLISLYL